MCGHVWHTADIHSQKHAFKKWACWSFEELAGQQRFLSKEPLFIDQSMEPSQVNSLLKSLNIPK